MIDRNTGKQLLPCTSLACTAPTSRSLPSRLLTHVREAEAAGFGAAMSSDHFSPWSERQGESGFAWSFLGAALQATELPFGVVNAPGQRYHPAIVAQAAASLCELFPGRLWVALGSGEASNEHRVGLLGHGFRRVGEIVAALVPHTGTPIT